MRPREFIALLGGIAAFPLAALVLSPAKIRRTVFARRMHEKVFDPLFRNLWGFGCNEHQNVIVEGHVERFRYFAAEMVPPKVGISIVVAILAAIAAVAVPQRHARLSQIAIPTGPS